MYNLTFPGLRFDFNNLITHSSISYITGNLERKILILLSLELREKCLYSEFFWSTLSRIWNEYGEMLRISPYSV